MGKANNSGVCDGTPGNAIGCELLILDISSTTNPTLAGGRDASGNSSGTGNADIRTFTNVGGSLYLGKQNSSTPCDGTPGNAVGCELLIFSANAQDTGLITGSYTGGNALNTLTTKGTITMSSNASTTDLIIVSGTTIAPPSLTIAGDYSNNGTFTHNSGTVVLASTTAPQGLSGNLSGTSGFNTLRIIGATTSATTTGLVGKWMFEEGSGPTARDASGRGNTGTLSGTSWTTGKIGNGLSFNGSSDFVDLGNPSSLDLSTANKFTLSAWVYPTSAPNGVGVISEMYSPTNTTVQYELGFDMDLGPGVSSKLSVGFYDGASWRIVKDSVDIALNEWVFITGTWNGTTLRLYKNGTEVNSNNPGGSLNPANFDKVVIGKRHDVAGTTNFFPGIIDDSRIYNRDLSGSEVSDLYNERPKTLSSNASTTNLYVDSGVVNAPLSLSLAGNYTNGGTFLHNAGTTTLSGTTQQIISGTATGTSAFYNLELSNGTASTTFNAPVAVTNHLKATTPSAKVELPAGATSTLNSATITGTAGNEVKLRSTTPGTKTGLSITGPYSITYTDVKDSSGTTTTGAITATGGTNIDSGNNNGWTFTIGGGGGSALTISGLLYLDGGQTLAGTGKSVTLYVATGTPSTHATTTGAGGVFSFSIDSSHTIGTATPLTIYVDGDASLRAVLITKASSTGNIPNLPLYKDRVIIKNEGAGATSTTIGDLALYDYDNDSDIPFTANSGTLSINQNTELYIWPNSQFYASGTVTINGNAGSSTDGSLYIGGTYTPSATTTIAGHLYTASTSIYTHGGTTLLFTATSSGKYITHNATSSLGNVRLTGTGNIEFMSDNATTSSLTIDSGTMTPPIGNLTVEANFTNSGQLNYYRGGTLILASTSAQTLAGNLSNTSALANVILRGGSTKTFSSSASTSNLTIEAGNTLSAPSALSVTGLLSNQGTFTNNAGSLTLAGASTTLSGTLTGASALAQVAVDGPARFAGGDASTTIPSLGIVADPTSGIDSATAVIQDQDYLYVTGSCTGCGSLGSTAYYTLKYRKADGSLVWSTTTDPTASNDSATAITSDQDYLYVTGSCTGCGSLGNDAYHTVKYRKADGSTIWATTTDPTTNSDEAFAITSDQDFLYVTGTCYGCGSSGFLRAYYTIKYSKTDGSRIWATSTDDGPAHDYAYAIIGDQDYLYVTGACDDCGSLGNDAFHTVKYRKTDGSTIWATTTDPTANNDAATAITEDQNFLYVTGYCVNCGLGSNAHYTIKYSKVDGSRIWATTTDPTTGADYATAITSDQDYLYATGYYSSSANYTIKYRKTDGATIWVTTIDPAASYDWANAITSDQDYLYVTGPCTACGSLGSTAYLTLKYDKSTGALIDGNNTARIASTAEVQGNLRNGSSATTSTSTLYAPSSLTIGGNFTNYDEFRAGGTITFASTTAEQEIGGNLTGANALGSITFSGGTEKLVYNSASTTNLTIGAGATVTSPYALSVSGDFSNSGAFTNTTGTLYLSGGSSQTISGNLTSSTTLGSVILTGGSTKTFSSNASTSNLTIEAGNTLSAPSALSVTGLLSNQGTFTNNAGSLTLAGASTTLSGTLTGASALNNVTASGPASFGESGATTTNPSSSYDYARVIWGDSDTLYMTGQRVCTATTPCGADTSGTAALYTIAYSKSDGSFLWSTTTNPSSSGDTAYGTWGDSDTLYVTGNRTCTATEPCGSDTSNITALYTIAYNKSDGSLRWSTTTNPSSSIDSASGTWGDSDTLYVTGYRYCTATTPCGADTSNTYAIYTIAYNKSDGSLRWSTTTNPSSSQDYANATWGDGDTLYVTGYRTCTATTPCDADTSGTALYTIAYNKQDGSLRFATTTNPSSSSDSAYGTWGDSDTLYVTGIRFCTATEPCGADTSNATAPYTIAYSKFDGSLRWSTTTNPSSSSDYVYGTWGDSDTLYVTGYRYCTATEPCGADTAATAFYTIAYNKSDGSLSWSTTTNPSSSSDSASDIWGYEDTLYVTGSRRCTATEPCGADTSNTSALYTIALNKSDGTARDGNNTARIGASASVTNFTVNTGATAVAPATGVLSVSGNLTQNGTFTAGTGTTTLNGTTLQTATGTLSGTSAFYNLELTNGSASTTFGAPVAVTNNFRAVTPNTKIELLANATSTLGTTTITGTAGNEVWLRSTTAGTRAGLSVAGPYAVSYADIKDSSATSSALLTGTSLIDSGNNNGWSFELVGGNATLSGGANQTFALNYPTTTMSELTITDDVTPSITSANDIRIKISTTTVRMLWDTNDTTATFGGTASAKVSNPVSYEADGAILVIPVDTNFEASDTLTISGLSLSQFTATNTATSALAIRTAGAGTTTTASDDKTVTITGSLTLADHAESQAPDTFQNPTETNAILYRYTLTPFGEDMVASTTIFTLRGVNGVNGEDLTNLILYKDMNDDGAYDAGDIQVGGSGAISITGQTGTITFSTPYSATTTRSYMLIGDVAEIRPGDMLTIVLNPANITAGGQQTYGTVPLVGSVAGVQHAKGGVGSHGNQSEIGGGAPEGQGIQGGGEAGGGGEVDTNTGGDTLSSRAEFNPPSSNGSPQAGWTTGGDAYTSDGSYATATDTHRHTYGSFNFNIPGTNQITGIEVELEAAATTEAGSIDVKLSWNGGNSLTSAQSTPTLTTTDTVYTLGGPSDTWDHSWIPTETIDGAFALEVIGQPNSNQVKIDAMQVRIYHQATGGGAGGGSEVSIPSSHHFASLNGNDGHRMSIMFPEGLVAGITTDTDLRLILKDLDTYIRRYLVPQK